jgi:hypothetical protein
VFSSGFDDVSSTTKVRQTGFGECHDSQDRFVELFHRLAAAKMIPPL